MYTCTCVHVYAFGTSDVIQCTCMYVHVHADVQNSLESETLSYFSYSVHVHHCRGGAITIFIAQVIADFH